MLTSLEIAVRLREALARSGKNASDLARECGVTPQAVHGWLTTGRVSKGRLPAISAALRISVGDLVGESGPQSATLNQSRPDTPAVPNTATTDVVLRSVPLISWVQAGTWSEVVDNLPVGAFDDLIKTTVPVGKHAFALRVVGDSMTNPGSGPSFPEGMVLIVDPDLSAEPRDFVVVRQNGDTECTFKQLVRDGHQWFLKPLNPRYPILEMREDAVIVGVVRQAALTFR